MKNQSDHSEQFVVKVEDKLSGFGLVNSDRDLKFKDIQLDIERLES